MEGKKLMIEFTSDIVKDNSFTKDYIGNFKSTMEIYDIEFISKTESKAHIEWIVEDPDEELVEHFSVTYENRKVIDYEGLFQLPREVKKLLRLINVSISNSFFED